MDDAAPFGPKTRPTRRYAIVEIVKDVPMKWTKMNRSEMRTIEPKLGEYASPQARAVKRRKKERRYVKEGSGRCHVFLVSKVHVNDVQGRERLVSHTFLRQSLVSTQSFRREKIRQLDIHDSTSI
jgi:hypothetical protein